MENNDKKKMKDRLQIAFFLALLIAIALLFIVIILFVKNVDLIKQNPVDYAIDNDPDMVSCTCFNAGGQFQDFFGTKKIGVSDGPTGDIRLPGK